MLVSSIKKPTGYLLGLTLMILGLVACDDNTPPPTSAAPNVRVLPMGFLIPELERIRTVRLYLPPGYEASSKHYPVLYMQDGQNLFDNATADAGEWAVDESLNKLASEQGLELIVVGIDNGGDFSINELSPWPNKRFGEAQGEQYLQFIVEVVKPYIDTNYRTLPQVQNTAIMGSSMGGLMAHYAIHQSPEVFGKAGIFSPSYWFSPDVFSHSKSHRADDEARLYVLFGSEEGDGMVADTDKMQRQLKQQGHPRQNMQFTRIEGGQHNEKLWREAFPAAVQWLFK
ncbi:MAG: putative alpha/beta superfamily hydrolase [Paraglaciecola sp.]|jgi:predicted alpha/beta superfamily hydrolase